MDAGSSSASSKAAAPAGHDCLATRGLRDSPVRQTALSFSEVVCTAGLDFPGLCRRVWIRIFSYSSAQNARLPRTRLHNEHLGGGVAGALDCPVDRGPPGAEEFRNLCGAIDFVAVNERGDSGKRGWRSLLATESPEVFVGFGAPILAPASGTVVATIDGELDHEARRSQLALIPCALSQARRIRKGVRAIAGNHVVIAMDSSGPFVLIAHVRRGSVSVAVGSVVEVGEPIGSCGNSRNSTQPHVHVQVTDSTIWPTARGRPIIFKRPPIDGDNWLPRNGEAFNAS